MGSLISFMLSRTKLIRRASAIIRSHETTTEACTIPTAVILPRSVMPRTSPSIQMLRIQLGFVYVHWEFHHFQWLFLNMTLSYTMFLTVLLTPPRMGQCHGGWYLCSELRSFHLYLKRTCSWNVHRILQKCQPAFCGTILHAFFRVIECRSKNQKHGHPL